MNNMQKTKKYCNKCSQDTWHVVLFSKEYIDEDYFENDRPQYYQEYEYSLIECCGCGNISLFLDTDGVEGSHKEYYPPLTFRRKPKWFIHIIWQSLTDNTNADLIDEIYIALKMNMPRLAAMGIRALIENIMIESIGDQGRFDKNLNEFESKGYISKIQKEAIDSVLQAGHAAIHRKFKPTQDNLAQLMDITENIIESIYINKINADKIVVPPRHKQPKSVK